MINNKEDEIENLKSKINDLESKLRNKEFLIKILDEKILPSLKLKIEDLEERILKREEELERIKVLRDLPKIEIHTFIPLPI